MGKWFAWIWFSIGILGWAWSVNEWTGYFLIKANYDHVRGTITDYITESVGAIQGQSGGGGVVYFPIVDFVYRGDSIHMKADVNFNVPFDLNEEVDLYFPPGKPEKADISTDFWAFPIIVFASSFFVFILPILIIGNWERGYLRHDMQLYLLGPADYRPILPASRVVMVATVLSFGFGLLLIWGGTRLTTLRVVEWPVVNSIYVIAAVLFALGYLGWRRINRKDIFKKHFDAKFERVIRSSSKDGGWVIECSWSDPGVIGRFKYVSLPFNGDFKYYNRDKILVNLAWRGNKIYYQVDLSFLSKDDRTGITIVDQAAIDNALKEQQDADVRYYKRHGRRAPSSKTSAVPVPRLQRLILWAIVITIVAGIALLFVRYNQLTDVNDRYTSYVTRNIDQNWGYDFEFETEIQSLWESPVYPTGWFTVNGTTHNRSWKMIHYLTATEENPRTKLNTMEDESWHLPFQMTLKIDDDSLSGENFLMVADFPDNFPSDFLNVVRGKSGVLKELSDDGQRDLADEYLHQLFDKSDDVTASEVPVTWALHGTGNLFSVVATNHPQGMKLLTPKFWAEYEKLKANSNVSGGLLITQWRVVIGTMNARMPPTQFESLINFGTSLADSMKKLE